MNITYKAKYIVMFERTILPESYNITTDNEELLLEELKKEININPKELCEDILAETMPEVTVRIIGKDVTYSKLENNLMDFGQALDALKANKLVARWVWSARGIQLKLKDSIIFICTDQDIQPGWLPSQADILANDWEIVSG